MAEWYFSISRLPEVRALPEQARRQLLSTERVPGPIRIMITACVRGFLLSLLLSGLLHMGLVWSNNQNLDRLLSPLAFVLFFVLGSAGFHFWIMTRFRGQIRMQIEEASRGSRTPVCLSCGQDVTGVASNQCPECGRLIQVPRIANSPD